MHSKALNPDFNMTQFFLFTTVALAWGFTWYAIHLQLGPTPDVVSIFWRFATAAGIMWLGLTMTGRAKAAPVRRHWWFAALGLSLFSGNFLCLYAAEHYVPSGLVAVVFSTASIFNAFNQWCFRSIFPPPRVLLGAAAGILGVGFLFAHQIAAAGQGHYVEGVFLALAGTYLFSLGNFVSRRASAAGVSLPNAIARGMSWGTAFLAAIILMQGRSFIPQASAPYLAGLSYLAIIGSVVAFLAYLSLVTRVGEAKAGYVTVISPVIALAVSAALEGYDWTLLSFAGVAFVLVGNVIIFTPVGRRRLAQ